MSPDQLAAGLLEAVRAQRFEQTTDSQQQGMPLGLHPSIDLAVAAFPEGGAPVFANVLFSREHPRGLVAEFDGPAGAVANIGFVADVRDSAGVSIAWQPGADWDALAFKPWFGSGPRFVAPYPASLLKIMVLVGVARLVDEGRTAWTAPLDFEDQRCTVGDWALDMMAISCNESTSALVSHLHALGAIRREAGVEVHNELHDTFAAYGLPGLRLANTQPDGGWGNAAGAGVGEIQVTAWDALRLLWLVEADAPPAPWLRAGTPPLLGESVAHVRHCLAEQALHEILSSNILVGLPRWVPGLPAKLPDSWPQRLRGIRMALLAQDQGEVVFAHKTGTTDNYASDAGSVRGISPFKRRYLVALTTNLGRRYAPHTEACTTWRLPALGAAIDALLKPWLEAC